MNYAVIAASIKKTIIGRKTKFLIAALVLATTSAFAQVPSYVPTNGLVGWWPFNGNANDESGNGNNGTVNGATLTSDRLGQANSASSFDGVNDYIDIGNLNLGISNQSFSVSVWFKTVASPSGYGYMISDYSSLNMGDKVFAFHLGHSLTNGTVSFDKANVPSYFFQAQTFLGLGQWNHMVIVSNASNGIMEFYCNGNFISQLLVYTSSINNQVTTPYYISTYDYSVGQFFRFGCDMYNAVLQEFYHGSLDDIGIWNRALTQQEITNLYNAQSCTGTGTITADGPTTFCAGNYVNLTSDVVGGTYQWKKNGVNVTSNGTSRTYKATATGSYTCVATCNGSALTSNAIQVTSKTNAAATVSASGATSFCAGDSVTLNCTNLGSNYSVQWYRTNISMENSTNYSLVVKQPGTYKVVTKNLTTGCSRISGSAITTNVNCRITGDVTSGAIIQENTNTDTRFMDNELSQGVHIFPNPNSGVFSFNYDGEETGDAVLQIINNMGQSIYQSRLTVPEGGFTQDLQLGDNITKGIYIVRLLINDSYHDSKVMVK